MEAAAPDEEADKLRRQHLSRFLQVSGGKSRREAREAIAALKRNTFRSWFILKKENEND